MAESVLRVEGVSKAFRAGGPLLRRRRPPVPAVHDVSVRIERGEILGLVGESGSGKSTLARMILGLESADRGSITIGGGEVTTAGRRELRRIRTDVAMVFQDPGSSLDPRWTVERILEEPLRAAVGGPTADGRRRRVVEMLEEVGLDASHAQRRPRELSGGQRQRVAIARALALSPKLVVCDEAVSALDVSTQAQALALLQRLSRDHDVALLFIAHDLAVVRHLCQRVAVMHRGHLVEAGPAEQVMAHPAHEHTRALVDAIPRPRWTAEPVSVNTRRALT